jgi:hypothetical protein
MGFGESISEGIILEHFVDLVDEKRKFLSRQLINVNVEISFYLESSLSRVIFTKNHPFNKYLTWSKHRNRDGLRLSFLLFLDSSWDFHWRILYTSIEYVYIMVHQGLLVVRQLPCYGLMQCFSLFP